MSAKTIIIDGQVYDIPTKYSSEVAYYLTKLWEKLGKPTTVDVSESMTKGSRRGKKSSGMKMMEAIVDIWKVCFPTEYKVQCKVSDYDKSVEASIRHHIKAGGYNTVSYPRSLFKIIRAIFPRMKLGDKKIRRKLTKKYPWLKVTKYKI